jgi:hypothetical protein
MLHKIDLLSVKEIAENIKLTKSCNCINEENYTIKLTRNKKR